MVRTTEGPHDLFSALIRGADDMEDETSMDFTQCSPSQLPTFPAEGEEKEEATCGGSSDDDARLNERVLSALQTLLRCPICSRLLLHDPAVVDTCGHAFCYDCINVGIEKGCFPISLPAAAQGRRQNTEGDAEKPAGDEAEREESVVSREGSSQRKEEGMAAHDPAKDSRSRREKERRAQPKQRRRKFTCPLCLGPVHKWNLVRVRFIRDLVMEFVSHAAIAETLPA